MPTRLHFCIQVAIRVFSNVTPLLGQNMGFLHQSHLNSASFQIVSSLYRNGFLALVIIVDIDIDCAGIREILVALRNETAGRVELLVHYILLVANCLL